MQISGLRDARVVTAVRTEAPSVASVARAPSVSVKDLRKTYGDVVALNDVSFDVHPGDVVGILGPNGAGKSTLIEILLGILKRDGGSASVLGVDVGQNMKPLRRRMGIVTQQVALPPLLTVGELFELHASYHAVTRDRESMLRVMGLTHKRDALVRSLSGGLHQRLAVALALLGDPELLFLDEPTSALDPQGRAAIWDLLLANRSATPRTIVLTTHRMEEAQQICTKVAILNRGMLLDIGSPSDLIERHCPGDVVRFTTEADAEFDALGFPIELGAPEQGGRRALIRTARLELVLEFLVAARRRRESLVANLRVERATLEDVFFKLTGRP